MQAPAKPPPLHNPNLMHWALESGTTPQAGESGTSRPTPRGAVGRVQRKQRKVIG